MSRREPFGDVEMMLVEYLTPRGWVGTTAPADMKAKIDEHGAVIRIGRNGGGEGGNGTTDEPRISMEVYAARSHTNPRGVHDVAAQIRADMLSLPAVTSAGRLDRAVTESGPTEIWWPDADVAAVQMIFRLDTRR